MQSAAAAAAARAAGIIAQGRCSLAPWRLSKSVGSQHQQQGMQMPAMNDRTRCRLLGELSMDRVNTQLHRLIAAGLI